MFGQLQPRAGLEQCFAGHRRADDFAGKFLDVHAGTGERGGDFADDAGTVVADDFQFRLRVPPGGATENIASPA